ncbi:MAG TPA: hypothetical protein VFM05_09750 [Candidatus Saccharimonadales bacterium]|nr:hypothetical protein [Candidatus Saccharimonadales bacterium]
MPASEFLGWQAYFSIYPFTFDRDDERHAELVSALTYINSMAGQGKYLKQAIPVKEIIPDYLGTSEPVTSEPSLEQQAAAFRAFHAKLKSVQGK